MAKSNQTKIVAKAGKQEVLITREFDVPRELVFKAFIDPKLYVKWLGPRGFTMHLEKFNTKNGGSYRYIHRDNDGNKYAFHGVYHEVLFPELIISTFEFEGLREKGHVELDTAKFEELINGKTKLTIRSVYQSVEDRDRMILSGMKRGVDEGFYRLEELLAKELIKIKRNDL